MAMNLLRGFLYDQSTIVTIFDPLGGFASLVDEFPNELAHYNLHDIPLGLFEEHDVTPTVLSALAEIYGMKMSRSELTHAANDLHNIYKEELGGAVPFSLDDLIAYLTGNYWRNPFDRQQSLRRTTVTNLQGISDRNPNLRFASGASPIEEIFDSSKILITNNIKDTQDLQFIITWLLVRLAHHLETTVTHFDQLKHVLIFDDAIDLFHKNADRAATTGISPLVNLTTKIGKYGVAFFILLQNLSQISETLLSNTANLCICGSFSDDIDLIKATRILGLETRQ